MPAHEISGYTDISDRKVRDILAHFKNTGSIIVSKREKATLHKSLQDEDIHIRKKGFGLGETQAALGNFVSPRLYLAPCASSGISGCL